MEKDNEIELEFLVQKGKKELYVSNGMPGTLRRQVNQGANQIKI